MWSSEGNGCPTAKATNMGTKMLVTIHINTTIFPAFESNNSLITEIEKKIP